MNNPNQESKPVTVDDLDELVQRVERRAQSRPIYRFGVLTLAVGLGSYFGAGRYVAKISKDVYATKKSMELVGNFFQESQTQKTIMDQFFGPRK